MRVVPHWRRIVPLRVRLTAPGRLDRNIPKSAFSRSEHENQHDRASAIHAAEPDEFVKKKISAVAVVRVNIPRGQVDLTAGSGDGLTPAQMPVPLRKGVINVPNIPGTHAEKNPRCARKSSDARQFPEGHREMCASGSALRSFGAEVAE